MSAVNQNIFATNRRRLLQSAIMAGGMAAAFPAWADSFVELALPGGPDRRDLTTDFPEKKSMILQRSRPPLLETPFEVFDQGVFTPNNQFFVRWHWAVIPQQIDVAAFGVAVRGHVDKTLSLSMADILAMPRVELAAVNQCSGNSRGLFQPRVAGGQWENGAMGNARWTGVALRDVLDRAGVKAGAVAVRFNGLDQPVVDGAPDFMKSLDIDHARDGEVMLAFQMNGEQLPVLNGFPLRLIVPGWYSTYWVKMLNDIEVLDAPDQNFWMATAYRIPDSPTPTSSRAKPDLRRCQSTACCRGPLSPMCETTQPSRRAQPCQSAELHSAAIAGCRRSKFRLTTAAAGSQPRWAAMPANTVSANGARR